VDGVHWHILVVCVFLFKIESAGWYVEKFRSGKKGKYNECVNVYIMGE